MDALAPTRSLVDRTYDALLNAICAGELRPGDRIGQDEIAERLNVSRQPVNSAIALLKAQRFVTETGRRGVVVAAVEPELLRAIYQVRAALEPLAVELATAQLDSATADRAQRLVAHGRALVAAADAPGLLQADIDFHTLIYETSGNPVIADTMRLNWLHLRRSMGEVLRLPDATAQVWREHAAILDAMLAGDTARAAALMRGHMARALERVLPPGSGGPVRQSRSDRIRPRLALRNADV